MAKQKEENSFLFYFMVVLIVLGFLLSVTMPAKADNTRFRGVVCDTAEQIENWATLFKGGTDGQEALDLINTAAANPTACGMVDIIVAKIEVEKEVVFNGEDALIYKMLAVAAVTPLGTMPIEPVLQYGAGSNPKQASRL